MEGMEVEEVEIVGEVSDDEIEILGALMDDEYIGDDDDILGSLEEALGDTELVGCPDYEIDDDGQVQGLFDDIAKAVKGAAKTVAKGVSAAVKSPIIKTVAGAAAIAFPPVGIPASAALVVADRAIRVAEGARGTPKQQAAMKRAISNTIKIASTPPGAALAATRAAAARTAAQRQAAMSSRRPAQKVSAQDVQNAKRAVEFMAASRRVRATQTKATFKRKPTKGVLVRPDGTIKRGNWVGA